MSKQARIITIVSVVVILLLGLLWYYQEQGFIQITPTESERTARQIAIIDESRYSPIEGITDEQFQGQIAEARELRQEVLDNPDDASAWFDFGSAINLLNDHEVAASAWERSYSLQPNDFRTATNLGNLYQYFIKDYPRSEFFYLKALELRPDHSVAYEGIADLYQFNWTEMADKFEPIMLQAIEKNPVNSARYHMKLVRFFADRSEFVVAQGYLDTLKELNPDTAQQISKRYPEIN